MTTATLTAPDADADAGPATYFDHDRIRGSWAKMGPRQRREFLRSVGLRASVREFGLPVVEVAMAWTNPSMPLDRKLEHVRILARS